MTVAQAMTWQTQLSDISDSPALDCQLLLGKVTGQNRAWLLAHDDHLLTPESCQQFAALMARRCAAEPIAYLLGVQGFWDMQLQVTPDTLIPRPETELLVEQLLTLRPAAQPTRLVDLGTGSGALAIAIARERPAWQVLATDQSAAALLVARRNAEAWNSGHIVFIEGHWLQPFDTNSLDVIVANPPYVAPSDEHLAALRHEPASALVAADDGYADLLQIIKEAGRCLVTGGLLLLEHGYEQQPRLLAALATAGFIARQGLADLNQQPRAVIATWPGELSP